ncbi:MAG: PrgI family protein [Erysipelotrichaceae bacterium]|nr:PrgI family protein [Erysipelotrichaceae bacterium]MDY6335130.1 PrgI family protein [Lachnospiraceae bacterium]
MDAYVSVPRDFTRVKSKVLFNLTKRQLICFSVAALTGVPSFFLIRKTGNMSLASMGMILIMLPFFFLAMYEKDGMPLEVLAQHFIEAKFIRPKERPYKTDNYYAALMRMAEAQEEVNEIVLEAKKRQSGSNRKAARKPDPAGKAKDRKDLERSEA